MSPRPELLRTATFALLAAAVASGVGAQLLVRPTEPMLGFSQLAARAERAHEELLAGGLDATRVDRDFRELTREPHLAGSPRNNELATYVADAFRAAGLEEVKLSEYDVMMSYPKSIEVEMTAPRRVRLRLDEDIYADDPDTANPRIGLVYNGFSASGDVEGEVVYAKGGSADEFAELQRRGIDLRGKIALVRHSVPYSYRGFKAYTAERLGLAGMLIFNDPQDDGAVKGPVYPMGPWGPLSHIQRGAILYDFLVPGDPLTPGWASLPGARRIPESESRILPKIPSTPIPARAAAEILAALGGDEAPESWRGGLDVPYHTGPGPARIHMKLEVPRPITKILNVTGLIRGSSEPEKIVLLGNHRDAWIFGGVDPSSGTASMLELARALGALVKEGWRPRRTIMLASWDAEEFALTGSTEWGEEHLDDLRRNLVAYLNVDIATSGRNFSASASATLAPLVEEVLRDTSDPETGRTVLDVWKNGVAGGGATAIASGGGKVGAIGSGSDHTVFLNRVGAPAIDMTFDGDYGVYHSVYDDYRWMTKFGDPGLRYMTKMAEVWGRMAMRLADAELMPLDYGHYGRAIAGYIDALDGPRVGFDLAAPRAAALAFAAAGSERSALLADPQRIAALDDAGRAAVNRALLGAERALLDPAGIPDRPWFLHLIYACRYTYAALVLPGLTEAVEAGDPSAVRDRARVLADALRRAESTLR